MPSNLSVFFYVVSVSIMKFVCFSSVFFSVYFQANRCRRGPINSTACVLSNRFRCISEIFRALPAWIRVFSVSSVRLKWIFQKFPAIEWLIYGEIQRLANKQSKLRRMRGSITKIQSSECAVPVHMRQTAVRKVAKKCLNSSVAA